MKNKIMICILLFLFLFPYVLCSQENNKTANDNSPSLNINNIINMLSNHKILRIDIYHISLASTRVGISPGLLEERFDYKLIIKDLDRANYRYGLLNALKSTSVKSTIFDYSVQTGIIFYDERDKRVGSLYFNDSGDYGYIGEVPVTYKGKIHSWLNSNFSGCFK
jgi:hypothetical protein